MVLSKLIFLISALILTIYTTKNVVNIRGQGALGSKGFILWQDYFLNFLGCFLGWVSIFYFLFIKFTFKLELVDLVIILFGYIGITGYLPHLIINKGFKV